jgi:hypothetical protein
MSALWSYALAALGITGLLIAANRPKIGWWFNIAAQTAWVAYAVATRQWGFLASALAYAVAYLRLLRRAYRPVKPVKTRVRYPGVLVLVATKAAADAWIRDHPEFSNWRQVRVASRADVQQVRGYFGPIQVRWLGEHLLDAEAVVELNDAVRVIEAVTQLASSD